MSAAEADMFAKLAARSAQARVTRWNLLRDRTGWPWLESDPAGFTIAKLVIGGRALYELWNVVGSQPIRVRELEPIEVDRAKAGEWTP